MILVRPADFRFVDYRVEEPRGVRGGSLRDGLLPPKRMRSLAQVAMHNREHVIRTQHKIMKMLVPNPKGNYSFLRGIAPYSGGTIADEGYEIVHVRFNRPLPLQSGFDRIREHLMQAGRPLHALCSMELRSPRPFTFQGFNDFNAEYVDMLREWDVLIDGLNPVARTNVAPETAAPAEPSVYAFSYTVASDTDRKTFIVAGGGELPEGSLDPGDVVRGGEISPAALEDKAQFVMGLMTGRLQGLGVSWESVTTADVYTVHPLGGFLESQLVRPMGGSAIHGFTWYYSRPPIVSIEFEMDARGCDRELIIA